MKRFLIVVLGVLCTLSIGWAQPGPEAREYPLLEHSGHLQVHFVDGDLGSSRENSFSPANNGLAPFPADEEVFVRRFRPVFKLHFSPRTNIDTEFEVDPHSGRIEILDAIVNHQLSSDTKLSVGRYKVPFGFEGWRSSRDINTAERSDATVYLYPERDVGVSLSHQLNGVGEVTVGTFLGQSRSNGDENGSLDLIGRATFPITPGLRLGVSGHLGTFRPTGSARDLPVRRAGAEVQYTTGPLTLEGEALWSDGYNTASRADTPAFGYYVSAVTRLAEPLDLVLSYDRFDPDRDAFHAGRASNALNARDRKVIGLNYYLSRKPSHRIMLNYEMRDSLEGPSLSRDGWRVRYQIAW